MRGRKPELQVIEGGPIGNRCPGAPAWLAPHAKAEWRRTAPEMHVRGLLTADTLATLESYCTAVATVRELEEVMRAEGRLLPVIHDPETKVMTSPPATHPAFRMQGAAMREARLLAAELGLTPHRRKAAAEKGGTDGWDSDLLA